ncbi:MAG: DnaD domain protein [Firmicutes bacterium]|nr:DnaD domain protein [Bacillota bacterium]MCL1954103.1 DnaD domain protein [Bacillota bacterium]
MFAKLSPQRAIDLRVSLDILFIEEYMPHSPENFLKVYLYGLALCSHNIEHDNSLEKIAKRLSVDTQTILSAYDYWQEQGLINVLPTVPISVEYLPIKDSSTNYRKKFNKDKYADFNKQLQHMLPSRQIMQNEYLEYYSAIENLHMQPEAMLSIISYCVRLKGIEIGFKYILTVARNLARDGILTFDAVNEHLNELKLYENDILQIFKALKLKRSVDHEDKALYLKWTKKFDFKLDTIVFVAKKLKSKKRDSVYAIGMDKLDIQLTKYKSLNKISIEEIDDYEIHVDDMISLAREIYHNLGQFHDNLGYFVENYIPQWLDLGFDRDSLLQIASYCFKKNLKTIDNLDQTIRQFYKLGLVNTNNIANYMQGITQTDNEIKMVLEQAGQDRIVNARDRVFYRTWTINWLLPIEVVIYAASLAKSTANPMPYINAILADWKNKGITTVESAKEIAKKTQNKSIKKPLEQAIQNSQPTTLLTSQQLNALFDSLNADEM